MAVEFLQSEARLDEEVEFDPRRDITEKDWEGMKGELERLHGSKSSTFEVMAGILVDLFPERRDELGLDEEVWNEARERLEAARRGKRWNAFASQGKSLITLFPDRRDVINLDEEVWRKMTEEIEENRQKNRWSQFVSLSVDLCRLFPNRRKELQLDAVWEELRQDFEKQRTDNLWSFWQRGRDLCLLFPDRKEELNLKRDELHELKKLFEEERRGKAKIQLALLASMLTILAAQDARITSDGQIQITPKKPALSKAPPPLPERARV